MRVEREEQIVEKAPHNGAHAIDGRVFGQRFQRSHGCDEEKRKSKSEKRGPTPPHFGASSVGRRKSTKCADRRRRGRGQSAHFVGSPGFEPRMTEPKPVVLPLHHDPIASAKLVYLSITSKCFGRKSAGFFSTWCRKLILPRFHRRKGRRDFLQLPCAIREYGVRAQRAP